MNYNPQELLRISKECTNLIEDDLKHAGIFYRLYFRSKSSKSLTNKLLLTDSEGEVKYNGTSKLLRDLIGIRINLYFVDDLELLMTYFKEKYNYIFLEETIDQNDPTEFKPTRVNYIFKLFHQHIKQFRELIPDNRIDATFELQLRTVFSEGWHEVEHDFRYKCPDDWDSYNNLSRTFNGILAALETHEWSMVKIMDNLSYNHYKTNSLTAMIRTKLRIRTDDFEASDTLLKNIDSSFCREFFKLERSTIIHFLLRTNIKIPFTIDNIIYLINFYFIDNKQLLENTPKELLDEFIDEIPVKKE